MIAKERNIGGSAHYESWYGRCRCFVIPSCLRAWTPFRTPSSCSMLSKVSNFLLLATAVVCIDCLVKRQRTVLSINYCQVKEGCITPRADWFLTISKLWTNSIVWVNGYNMDKAKIIQWINEKYKMGTECIFIIFIFIIN